MDRQTTQSTQSIAYRRALVARELCLIVSKVAKTTACDATLTEEKAGDRPQIKSPPPIFFCSGHQYYAPARSKLGFTPVNLLDKPCATIHVNIPGYSQGFTGSRGISYGISWDEPWDFMGYAMRSKCVRWRISTTIAWEMSQGNFHGQSHDNCPWELPWDARGELMRTPYEFRSHGKFHGWANPTG